MRTFIAIGIPKSDILQDLYNKLINNLTGLKVKYTDIHSLHITLAFLGQTSTVQSSAITEHLSRIAASSKPFEIQLKNVGYFGNKTSPSIIWSGINPSEELLKLHSEVNICIQKENFKPDPRKYSPHLTLARVRFSKPDNNCSELTEQFMGHNFGTILVDKLIYYESILLPEGPKYNPLGIFHFKKL